MLRFNQMRRMAALVPRMISGVVMLVGVREADLAIVAPAGRPPFSLPRAGGGCGGNPAPGQPATRRAVRLLTFLAMSAMAAGCATPRLPPGPDVEPEDAVYADELDVDFSRMERTSGGLWVEVVTEGVGRQAVRGREAVIHFVGFLPDGTVIDSSLNGEPYAFELGSGEVIRGWNEGILGMKVGGRRRLVVRPTLGYGGRGKPPLVPPRTILVFDIQLMDVR